MTDNATMSGMARYKQALASGERYGRYVVLGEAPPTTKTLTTGKIALIPCVLARCDCGTERSVPETWLRCGYTQSCGCGQRDAVRASGEARATHGHTRKGSRTTPENRTWLAMRRRCVDPTVHNYSRYGGRGITVCDRWLGKDGFVRFLADMGPRPEGRTLDRADPDGNYEPSNCRWSTPAEQAANKGAPICRTCKGRYQGVRCRRCERKKRTAARLAEAGLGAST